MKEKNSLKKLRENELEKVTGGGIFSTHCFRCGNKIEKGHEKHWYKNNCCELCFDKLDKAQTRSTQFDTNGQDITQQISSLKEEVHQLKTLVAVGHIR